MISGDVPHDGRGRDSHLRAAGRPRRQIGLYKKPLLMFGTSKGRKGWQRAPPEAYQQIKDAQLPIRKLSIVFVNHIEVDIILVSGTKMLHSELVTNKKTMKCEGFSKMGAWPMEDMARTY